MNPGPPRPAPSARAPVVPALARPLAALLLVVVLASALRVGAPPARADAPAPSAAEAASEARAAQLVALLPPALAAVVRPMPRMRDHSMAEKLAFMAELGRRADARAGWSDDPAWRAIMGWPEPGDTLFTWDRTAPDRSPLRYPVPAGRDDPALDLAASVAVGWLDPKTLSCRFPLRARYLVRHGLLRGPLPLDEGRCPVDRAVEWPRVDGVEVLFVTPTWGDPSASMGHVVFRVRHAAGPRVTGESDAPTFAFTAREPASGSLVYLLRGVTGGLTATIRIERFGEVFRRYAVDERRDLEVYDLRLAREDLHDLLAEVWAAREAEMAVPYAFFSVNCASLAWDLVRAVRPDLPERANLMTHPHEVVSGLLSAGLLAPRGRIPSLWSRAVRGERARAALAPDLAAVPGFAALHAARDGDAAARAAAYRAFATGAPPAREDLAAYVDAAIDLERQALVEAAGRYDPGATGPALDAALDLRAALPARPDPPMEPLPRGVITPSGSRHRALAVGVSSAGRAEASLVLAVLSEEAGESRQAILRRAGRMVVLRSETRVSTDGRAAGLEAERLTVLEAASWGVGLESGHGWLAARTGFLMALGSESWPREAMPFAVVARAGLGLTLAATPDFAGHLVLGADVALESWAVASDRFRGGLGAFVEAALPLGSPENRWRLTARLRPAYAVSGGLELGAELETALDLAVDAARGLVLRPSLSWRAGLPAGNGLRFGIALAW